MGVEITPYVRARIALAKMKIAFAYAEIGGLILEPLANEIASAKAEEQVKMTPFELAKVHEQLDATTDPDEHTRIAEATEKFLGSLDMQVRINLGHRLSPQFLYHEGLNDELTGLFGGSPSGEIDLGEDPWPGAPDRPD